MNVPVHKDHKATIEQQNESNAQKPIGDAEALQFFLSG